MREARTGTVVRAEARARHLLAALSGGLLAEPDLAHEVPQLLNVLVGDMALVGPRPVLPAQAEQMPAALRTLRESVRPGLTGLWQVSGRSNMTLRQMTRFDALYVRRRSSMLDLWLVLCTPRAVLSARGAY